MIETKIKNLVRASSCICVDICSTLMQVFYLNIEYQAFPKLFQTGFMSRWIILGHECAILQQVYDIYNIYFTLKQYFRYDISKTAIAFFQSLLIHRKLPVRIFIKSDGHLQCFEFQKHHNLPNCSERLQKYPGREKAISFFSPVRKCLFFSQKKLWIVIKNVLAF